MGAVTETKPNLLVSLLEPSLVNFFINHHMVQIYVNFEIASCLVPLRRCSYLENYPTFQAKSWEMGWKQFVFITPQNHPTFQILNKKVEWNFTWKSCLFFLSFSVNCYNPPSSFHPIFQRLHEKISSHPVVILPLNEQDIIKRFSYYLGWWCITSQFEGWKVGCICPYKQRMKNTKLCSGRWDLIS